MSTPTARPKRYALAIELTSYCNQKCSYCYNAWRDDGGKSTGALPTDALLALVDRALTEVEFDHVTLTGGEPFSRPDFFDVIDLVARHGLRAHIISNGGLITDEICAKLAPYNPLGIQVTLDGPTREMHDDHVGGAGHYERTLRGMRSLVAHGLPLVGSIVITRKNAAYVGAVLEQFRELGVRSVALSRFSPAGYASQFVAELLPSRSDMITALDQAEPFGRDHGIHLQVTMPVPPCVIEHEDYPHVSFGGCPIGTEMQELALGPRGELRNCTLHTEVVGELSTTSMATLVESDRVMHYRDVTPEFCAPCPHRSSCLGGCGAAAGAVLGDDRGLDPFVAQHVDPAFRDRLRAARAAASSGVLPVSGLVRRATV